MAIDGYETLTLENSASPSAPPSPPASASASVSLLEPSLAEVDVALRRLEAFLSALGLNHSSTPLLLYSLSAFAVLGMAVPVAVVRISECEGSCEVYRVLGFEVNAIVSQTLLSGLALAFVSSAVRKLGVRRLVCADRGTRDLVSFRKGYAEKIGLVAVVQVVGTVLCLNAASKISHRVQSIASVASKWHALITCSSLDSSNVTRAGRHENIGRHAGRSLRFVTSEVDLQSLNNAAMQETLQVASNGSSYQQRQALVTYLQTNPGGITIYGFTVDRALINTIFCIELSLVLFVLGKTLVISQE